MNLKNTMVCWNKGGNVELIDLSDPGGRSGRYEYSGGACYGSIRDADFQERKCMAFILANTLIVRDGCDPKHVHTALSGLEEYIDGLPDDMLSVAERKKRFRKEGCSF